MAIHTYKITRNFYFIFRKLHAVTGRYTKPWLLTTSTGNDLCPLRGISLPPNLLAHQRMSGVSIIWCLWSGILFTVCMTLCRIFNCANAWFILGMCNLWIRRVLWLCKSKLVWYTDIMSSKHLHDHRLNTNSLQQECDDNHSPGSEGKRWLTNHRLRTNSLQQECDDNHPQRSGGSKHLHDRSKNVMTTTHSVAGQASTYTITV